MSTDPESPDDSGSPSSPDADPTDDEVVEAEVVEAEVVDAEVVEPEVVSAEVVDDDAASEEDGAIGCTLRDAIVSQGLSGSSHESRVHHWVIGDQRDPSTWPQRVAIIANRFYRIDVAFH